MASAQQKEKRNKARKKRSGSKTTRPKRVARTYLNDYTTFLEMLLEARWGREESRTRRMIW
jgi:hypothetical protein